MIYGNARPDPGEHRIIFMKKITFLIILIMLHSNVIAGNELLLIQPTLKIEQVIIHAQEILAKGECEDCKIVGIFYEYIHGEWIIYIARENGPLGSDFHFIMDDKNPSKYKIVGGA